MVYFGVDSRLDLKDIVLIGRTFDEYSKMFNLEKLDRKNERILDIASGVSSFCSEAYDNGYDVTACDSIYRLSKEEIAVKAVRDIETVMEKLPDAADLYKWEYFKDLELLKANRKKAYEAFLEDYGYNTAGRYKFSEFPEIGFDDDEFTILLSSHFLFLYDEKLDFQFHKDTIGEMLRVCSKEIRIFPLVNLKGQKSGYLRPIIYDFFNRGYGISIEKTGYEFVKNGYEMLIISKT